MRAGAAVANEAISGTAAAGAGEADAFVDLHAEREALERRLVLTQQRQQFGTDAADIARAAQEEREALGDLDRVLTQIRAAEYRRRPGARRW
jgi:hypothetical protein